MDKAVEPSSLLLGGSARRAAWASLLTASLLLSGATALRADEFTVTSGTWGPASTPNTLAWAIEQANASSAPDNVIPIPEGLEILVDGAESTGVLDLARITRSVRIEGRGATRVRNPTFVTSGGLEISKDAPTRFNPASDILVMGSYSFANIGLEGVDNSGIHVVINLYSSAVMVAPDESDFPGQIAYRTAGLTPSGTLTADAYSFVHTIPGPKTIALQSLFAQPEFWTLSGLSQYVFSPDPLIRSLIPFSEGAYALAIGSQIDVVPDAAGAHRLVNPSDGGFILTDAFRDPRTTLGQRSTSALRVGPPQQAMPMTGMINLTTPSLPTAWF